MECPDCLEKMNLTKEGRVLLPPPGFFYSPHEGGPEKINIELKQTFHCHNCPMDLIKVSYQAYEKVSE